MKIMRGDHEIRMMEPFSGTAVLEGRPEEEARLDDFRGMGRVSDLTR